MFILRNTTSKALVLLCTMALLGSACDAEGAAPQAREDPSARADVPADAPRLVDQVAESEFVESLDAAEGQVGIDTPNEVMPPANDVHETVAPVPGEMQTATFALG